MLRIAAVTVSMSSPSPRLRRSLVLEHCKWDPQVGDVGTLADFRSSCRVRRGGNWPGGRRPSRRKPWTRNAEIALRPDCTACSVCLVGCAVRWPAPRRGSGQSNAARDALRLSSDASTGGASASAMPMFPGLHRGLSLHRHDGLDTTPVPCRRRPWSGMGECHRARCSNT